MGIEIGAQAYTLGGACALGFFAGLFYDVLRILRRRLRLRPLSAALDLLFWIAVTAALFLYALTCGGGVLRLYMTLGVLGGGVVYFSVFSRFFLRIGFRIADAIGRFFRLLWQPFAFLGLQIKKIHRKFKNLFSSVARWYRINTVWARRRKKEESHETVGSFREADYFDFASGSFHFPSGTARPDPRRHGRAGSPRARHRRAGAKKPAADR